MEERNICSWQDKNFEGIFEKTQQQAVLLNKKITELKKTDLNDYLKKISDLMLRLYGLAETDIIKMLRTYSLSDLKAFNTGLYEDILPGKYENSYSDPAYSVKKFGLEQGKLFAVFAQSLYLLVSSVFRGEKYELYLFSVYFEELYKILEKGEVNLVAIKKLISDYEISKIPYKVKNEIYRGFSRRHDFYKKWIMESDLSDPRFLFYYGLNISDAEIETAEFINSLPEEKIERIMRLTAESYILGFEEAKKDYRIKKTVIVSYRAGLEKMIRKLILILREYGLEVLIGQVQTNKFDKQLNYDHRFDSSLWLDNNSVSFMMNELKETYELFSEEISACSGSILFDSFGEKPFSPVQKESCFRLTPEQIQLNKILNNKKQILFSNYFKRSETSFTIIGFPTPEIGKDFRNIFEDTLEINMLSHEKWLEYHQSIIDTLDRADYVHVKGRGENKTDIKIKLKKIGNPDKETNFFNCGATLNIPVGEVFTSPVLKETTGVLHIARTYLKGLLFKDLYLTFEDGYIVNYNCSNFDNPADNKKYIEENLLFPHKSLPMGEFAIGTNTLAYKMASKYDILSVLPILIIEKMGPHFAVGDTCYSWREDQKFLNPDGKEIIAKDNEHSIMRKEDISKAYTQCHTDITLPYEDIELIQAVISDDFKGEIIKKGRFVLKGTEELNRYFDED